MRILHRRWRGHCRIDQSCWCSTTASTSSRHAPGSPTICCAPARGSRSWRRAGSRSASRARPSTGSPRSACRRRTRRSRSSKRLNPCSCSSSGRGRCGPASISPMLTPKRWARSAAVSTGSRWPSSWPRRGFACSVRPRSLRPFPIASRCSREARAPPFPASERWRPLSSGATSCSTRTSAPRWRGYLSSPARSVWTAPRRCPPTSTSMPTGCSTWWLVSSTARWCRSTSRPGEPGTGCSRRFVSTPRAPRGTRRDRERA